MRLSTTFSLERLRCVEEHDNFGAEPYLWTAFFHSDAGTIDTTGVADTIVPLASDAGRSLIPDGIDDGESVVIPASVGRRSMPVDIYEASKDRTVAGVLFVLIEENFSSEWAMAQGQREFGEALDELIQPFVFQFPSVTDEQLAISELARAIQARVETKIKESSSWTAYFKPQDRVLGYGAYYLRGPQLLEMALNPARPHTFSATLQAPRPLQGAPHSPPIVIVEEYEIRGSVRVRMAPPVLDGSVHSVYDAAVAQLDKVHAHVSALRAELAAAPRGERAAIKAELDHQNSVVLASAFDSVDVARQDYYAFTAKTEAGQALAERRAERQKRLASASHPAPSAFRGPPVSVALARALNEPRASDAVPIGHDSDGAHRPLSRSLAG